MCFDRRAFFLYKAQTELECMAIRKQNWKPLLNEFDKFATQLKLKFLNHYDWRIRRPLLKKREKDIKGASQRKDYDQVLVV